MATNLTPDKDGKITYRHSLVKDSKGKTGLLCSCRVGTLSPTEQGAVIEELLRLQEEQPRKRPDWVNNKAWDSWGSKLVFLPPDVLNEVKTPNGIIDEVRGGDVQEAEEKEEQAAVKKGFQNRQLENHYRKVIAQKDKRIKELEALLDTYADAAGIATDAEKDFTLGEAYVWALAFFKAKTEAQTKKVLTIIGNLTELLGHDTKWTDLKARIISEAIEGVSDWSENTKRDYRMYAKTWLGQVQKDMKFRHDPTDGLVAGSVITGLGEDKELIDPRVALKTLEKSSALPKDRKERLKLAVAVCGFGGMRLGEGLKTCWEGLQLPVIEVEQAQKGRDGKPKKRWGYCFENITDYLPIKLPKSGAIFEGVKNYDVCEDATLVFGKSIFNALRHWHSTEMAKDAETSRVEAIANGHTKTEAARSYQDSKTLLQGLGNRRV